MAMVQPPNKKDEDRDDESKWRSRERTLDHTIPDVEATYFNNPRDL